LLAPTVGVNQGEQGERDRFGWSKARPKGCPERRPMHSSRHRTPPLPDNAPWKAACSIGSAWS